MKASRLKSYILPTTETVSLRQASPLLDGIGIHHSLGLNEDAANKTYLDFDEEDDAGDTFFNEEEGF